MKNLLLIGLVIILALIMGFSEKSDFRQNSGLIPKGDYYQGLLKAETGSYNKISNYKIKVIFDPQSKYITVDEEILWRNLTEAPTNEIQLHFYANAYKSSKTVFASSYNITKDAETEIEIKDISVNDKKVDLIFFQPEVKNPNDSTVARIELDKTVNPADSVKIKISYKMKIPRSIKRLGYATGRNFFFVSQWFPKVGVFEEGKWICSQYHPNLNFYSDFGDYDIQIETPAEYIVGATGFEKSKEQINGKNLYRFVQNGVHDFAWFASDEILSTEKIYRRKDGTELLIKAFIQPERKKYSERYIKAVENSLSFFENNIGVYPYHTITLVDVPKTCAAGGMEYPTLFTVSADLFSPQETHQPEGITIHEFSHQFFYGLLANNEVYEAWLDEGFAEYITEKILAEFYGREIVSFKLAGYVPFYGMNLHSFGQIPVIYTLTNLYSDEGAENLESYYKNLTIGSIIDTSYKLPTPASYYANAYHKPALALLSLERYLGHSKMMEILKEYFNACKFKHPKAKDFKWAVQKKCAGDMNWYFKNIIESSYYFDYKVKSITRRGNGEYDVLVERGGDGFFKNNIAFFTEKDTLYQEWNDDARWKIFHFKTDNEVIGAEIDPQRKNLLDINFANNSITLKQRYGASISIAMRWFFWVQNALMTLGGLG